MGRKQVVHPKMFNVNIQIDIQQSQHQLEWGALLPCLAMAILPFSLQQQMTSDIMTKTWFPNTISTISMNFQKSCLRKFV